jgi:hypothetical protein
MRYLPPPLPLPRPSPPRSPPSALTPSPAIVAPAPPPPPPARRAVLDMRLPPPAMLAPMPRASLLRGCEAVTNSRCTSAAEPTRAPNGCCAPRLRAVQPHAPHGLLQRAGHTIALGTHLPAMAAAPRARSQLLGLGRATASAKSTAATISGCGALNFTPAAPLHQSELGAVTSSAVCPADARRRFSAPRGRVMRYRR